LQRARNTCSAPVEHGYPRFLYGNRIQQLPRISNKSRGSYPRTARPVQHPKRGDVSPSAGASAPHNQQPHSAGSFGELEELSVGQVGELEFLRERTKAVLLDDLSAIGLHRQVDDLRLQIERI
jgi:hypothetical protein